MRLWSIHPRYLDSKGLVACWREGLLARKVLRGETRGYRQHPQLERFRASRSPLVFIDTYLKAMVDEADRRGYCFDRSKLGTGSTQAKLAVTSGQLEFEFDHLKEKLSTRDPRWLEMLASVRCPTPHPLFTVIQGVVEGWERL